MARQANTLQTCFEMEPMHIDRKRYAQQVGGLPHNQQDTPAHPDTLDEFVRLIEEMDNETTDNGTGTVKRDAGYKCWDCGSGRIRLLAMMGPGPMIELD